MPADNNFMPGEQSGMPNDVLGNLLLKKQSTPKQPSLTVDDINNYNFGLTPEEEVAYNESQQKFQPQKEVLSNEQYYPGMNQPIGVGQSSGRIIGSQTQYVPNGGLVPIGMFDARDAAIQKAAMAKAQDVEDWKKRNVKAPVSNLTNINEKLTKDYFEFEDNSWKDALKSAKGDANKARFIIENNNEYQSRKKGFYDAAKMGDSVVQKIESINASKDKGYFVSKELQSAIDNMYSIADPSSEGFKNSSANLMKLDTVKDMNDVVNDIKKNLDTQIDAGAYINQDDPEGIVEGKWTKEYYTPSMIDAAKKQAYAHYGLGPNGEGGSSYANKETIDRMLNESLGSVKKSSNKNWQNKPQEGGRGEIEQLDETNLQGEGVMSAAVSISPSVKSVKGKNGSYEKKEIPGQTRQGDYTVYDVYTLKKPVPVVIPANAEGFDNETGQKTKSTSVRKGLIGGLLNAPYYKGVPVDDEFLKSAGENTKKEIKYVPSVSIQFEENKKGEDGKTILKSETIPLSYVKSAVVGKGGRNKDFINSYEQKAKERNSKSENKKPSLTKEQLKKKANDAGYSYDEYYQLVKDKINLQ